MHATIPSILAGECQKMVRFARVKYRGNASKISRNDRTAVAVISSLPVPLGRIQRVEIVLKNFIKS